MNYNFDYLNPDFLRRGRVSGIQLDELNMTPGPA